MQSRSTMETCISQNDSTTGDSIHCAWDTGWSICVNKKEESFHPHPERFIYRVVGNETTTVSNSDHGKNHEKTRIIRKAGGKVIVKVAGEKIVTKVGKKALKCIPIVGTFLAVGYAVSTVAADPYNTLSWGQAAIYVGTSIMGPIGVAVDIVGCSVVAYNNSTR